jgi:hypothetical protein
MAEVAAFAMPAVNGLQHPWRYLSLSGRPWALKCGARCSVLPGPRASLISSEK